MAVDSHDIPTILSSPDRDFLIKNNGDQVKIESLKGKKIALYFSASWCGPCQRFTPKLVELYNELHANGDFEVIFLSADQDEVSFNKYFSKMPWLAVPFSDSDCRNNLDKLFKVSGIPHLVFVDENGKVMTEDGTEVILEYGVDAYPFTPERLKELKDQEEAARREQTLRSILVSRNRDYIISSDRKKVPVSELEGKLVGLLFVVSSHKPCRDFMAKIVDVYEKLKDKGEKFEIVLMVLDDEEEDYTKGLAGLPWFALPFKDQTTHKLTRYFELETIPTLVIIGPDGKTLHKNVVEAVDEHGFLAYPFTPEKFAELKEIERAKEESQTLESILVSGDRDFVIGKDGVKIPVADLVGKNILLSFSAHWCPPCRAFLPALVETYHKIKAKDDAFEIIFISSDSDQASFDDYFSQMPWLALPFGDVRKQSLSRKFKIQGIPSLVAIGPSGRTVSKSVRELIMMHGADAYPFTDEREKELEAQIEEMVKGWPEKLKHKLHEEHELVLSRRKVYTCDACEELGQTWAFSCDECDFDLHTKCALKEDEGQEGTEKKEDKPTEEWVCDGDVCRKA